MALFDLPLPELQTYRPSRDEPTDFDDFWAETIELAHEHPLNPVFSPVDSMLTTVSVYDLRFSGWNGERIAAWLLIPRHTASPLPCVVEYLGYGNGRSLPHERLLFSAAGYAHLVMDTRGQGSDGQPGDTPDPDPEPRVGQYPGFMTRGIHDPRAYYYRRLVVDATRAIEAARAHADIDAARVAIYGRSQGGGVALAAAALVPDIVGMVADVPFLCHYRRACEITDSHPYAEITHFIRTRRDSEKQVFGTLSYFDGLNFAVRASAPALFSVALMDDVCPPSTVYAAYNHYAGDKQIAVWPFNAHESGEAFHQRESLHFLHRLLNATTP